MMAMMMVMIFYVFVSLVVIIQHAMRQAPSAIFLSMACLGSTIFFRIILFGGKKFTELKMLDLTFCTRFF